MILDIGAKNLPKMLSNLEKKKFLQIRFRLFVNQGRFVLELVILEGTYSMITFLIWFENAW